MNDNQRALFHHYIENEKRNLDMSIVEAQDETMDHVVFRNEGSPVFMTIKFEHELMKQIDERYRHQIVPISTETKKQGDPRFPHAFKRYEFLYEEEGNIIRMSANVEKAGQLRQTILISFFPYSSQSRISVVDENTQRELVHNFQEIVMSIPAYRLHYVTGEYTWKLPLNLR